MTSTLALFGQLAVSLAVVLGLMALCARLLRRTSLGQSGVAKGRGARRGHIQLLARQNLSKTTSVAVLRVGDAHLLVGVSDSSVQVLRELDDATFAEPEEATAQPRTAAPVTFSTLLESLRDRTVRRA
jgi:flagellar protein FliO/FliZ